MRGRFVLMVGLFMAGLAGCASAPNQKLIEAQTVVAQISDDEEIVSLAPVMVAEAREILSRAQRAQDDAEITHRAELSLIKAQTAKARARQKRAESRAEKTSRQAEDLLLDARAREAQNALRQARQAQRDAALAQQRAAEAQRRAEELRSEAAAERARAQAARSQVETTQDRLNEVQRTLAELNPRLTERGLVLMLGEVLFNFDSANLKLYTQRIMDRVAEFLRANPARPIRVEGHTDSVGDAVINTEFSRARAQSVTDALINRGVSSERLSTQGFGESRPIASNETEAGRRENRRVEIIIGQAP